MNDEDLTFEQREMVRRGIPDQRHGIYCRCVVCDTNHTRRPRVDPYERGHDVYCRCRACAPGDYYR